MKNFALAVLPILLLLAAAAPGCLAAENATADQQPAPQYSKLPPLQLSGSTLTQKEFLQAALWLAQHNSNQANSRLENNSLLGVPEQLAAILFSPIATLIAAIISVIVAIFSALHASKMSSKAQKDINELQKQLQKNNFMFQREQNNLADKNKILLEFITSTSIDSIRTVKFKSEDIRNQQLLIDTFNDEKLTDITSQIMAVLNKKCDLQILQYPTQDKQSENALQKYTSLHMKLLSYAKTISRSS